MYTLLHKDFEKDFDPDIFERITPLLNPFLLPSHLIYDILDRMSHHTRELHAQMIRFEAMLWRVRPMNTDAPLGFSPADIETIDQTVHQTTMATSAIRWHSRDLDLCINFLSEEVVKRYRILATKNDVPEEHIEHVGGELEDSYIQLKSLLAVLRHELDDLSYRSQILVQTVSVYIFC